MSKPKPDKFKAVKIQNKMRLYFSNDEENYESDLVLSESTHALLHHLFSRSYSNKIFGLLKKWKRDPGRQSIILIDLLLEVQEKIKDTRIPRTKYQIMYTDIKKSSIKGIDNIIKTMKGIKGKPNEKRRLRALAKKVNWNEYFFGMLKKGERYQILSK